MRSAETALCVDFGSTFTKAVLVDLAAGEIVAVASHPTTVGTDVLEGYAACMATLTAADPRASEAVVHACSSAGGGLRIGVVGNEELVTAEAGRRVALSSGGKVVAVIGVGQRGDDAWVEEIAASEPDVVLLTGGTDGGNAEALLASTRALVAQGWTTPVVVAGNVDARDEVTALLAGAGIPHVPADNVLPRIGRLAPESARAAVRAMFLTHVIGGKHLSASPDFAAMVRGATPDVVLTGVDLLAHGHGAGRPGVGDVVVVDVGGATTDVYSAVRIDPGLREGSSPDSAGADEDAGLSREVVAPTALTRTVEGDLGMRWSAVGTVEAAHAAGLLDGPAYDALIVAADRRRRDPALLPDDAVGRAEDEAIARAAVTLALRRHAARPAAGPGGVDLREVALLVGSGGVLRHGAPGVAKRVLDEATGDAGGWQLPRAPRVGADGLSVLAVAGLLAPEHPAVAHALLEPLRRICPPGE